MKPRINLITLGVADVARSAAFYERLGLPRHPFESDHIAFFALDGTWLAVHPRADLAEGAGVAPAGSGFAGITLGHNLASPAEVDAMMEEALAAGATLTRAAQPTHWGGYVGCFTDPDGFVWEVAHVPHFWIGPRDEA